MTQKHTPCTRFHWIGETLLAQKSGKTIKLCNVDWSGLDEYEAEHKSLIAAAPELLEALIEILDAMPFGDEPEKARAAIAKAKGEAE